MSETTSLLLKLQRTLWARNIRDNIAAGMLTVLVVIYALGGLALLTGMLVLAAQQDLWSALAGMVGVGTLAYVGVAVVLPSGEAQLRPAMFTALPVTTRQLLPALAWSTLLTSRGMIAAVCTLVTAVAGVILLADDGHVLAAVVLPVALLAALVTTLLLGELIATLGSGGGRISRERSNILGALLVVVFLFAFNAFAGLGVEAIPLHLVGDVLGWTPFGASIGVITSAVQGRWLIALGQLLVAAATLAVGGWWWRRAVERQLEAPLDAVGSARAKPDKRRETEAGTPLLLPGLPYTPAAMVYSRAVRYLRRDSRMLASLVMFPVIAAFFLIQGVLVHEATMFMGMILIGLMAGTLAANDFGHDGPATWVHMTSGAPVRTLLLARHAASMTPLVVLLIMVDVLGIILADSRDVAVLVAVVSVGMAVAAGAIALFFTTFNPFATSRPGTSPWADKSGYSGAAFLSAFAALFIGWLPAAPGAALIAISYQADMVWLLVLGVALVLALPAALYAGSVALCTRRVGRRLPEIHHKVRAWVN